MRRSPTTVLFALIFLMAHRADALERMLENGTTRGLTPAEVAELGDPFFKLVLQSHSEVAKLSEVVELIQPDRAQRRIFVVDEEIVDPRPQQGGANATRRTVLGFEGSNSGRTLKPNIMLSATMSSKGFPQTPGLIEAWGWDDQLGRYDYYSREATDSPPGPARWFFHGSSADVGSPESRGRCLGCHINGAPLMKELFLPWNHWHSLSSPASYLVDSWPAKTDLQGPLRGAEILETDFILPSIRRFNQARLKKATQPELERVTNGRELLAPLFTTTEYNVLSSRQASGMHPLDDDASGKPSESVKIPNSFFLNADLIGGRGDLTGLGIVEANNFRTLPALTVTPDEYARLVSDSKQRIANVEGADANFAWFGPEASFIDNDMVDLMMRRGVLSKGFVAAVLAVDLETPILSADREKLLQFVPQLFVYQPLAPGAAPPSTGHESADLTKQVVAALRAANPPSGSPEAMFLERLESPDPVGALRADVKNYQTRLRDSVGTDDPEARKKELERLHDLLLARRQAVTDHRTLGLLNENRELLFPLKPSG